MFAKSKQIGLVSLFVVLATALGGCAESVGNEPASVPSINRPTIALSRFIAPPEPELGVDASKVAKSESLRTQAEAKRTSRTAFNAMTR